MPPLASSAEDNTDEERLERNDDSATDSDAEEWGRAARAARGSDEEEEEEEEEEEDEEEGATTAHRPTPRQPEAPPRPGRAGVPLLAVYRLQAEQDGVDRRLAYKNVQGFHVERLQGDGTGECWRDLELQSLRRMEVEKGEPPRSRVCYDCLRRRPELESWFTG